MDRGRRRPAWRCCQQFLRTASDGWELALTSVRDLFAEADLHADEVGGDFAGEAQRLGAAVARTHALLAEHFPVLERTPQDQRALAAAMAARLDAALEIVPDLAPYADGLRSAFDAVAAVEGGTVQRVHGDLHLGQTLRTPRAGRSSTSRASRPGPSRSGARPTPPARRRRHAALLRLRAPLAAMTAGATGEDDSEQRAYRAAEWSARNRAAFLDGYAGRELTGDEQILLAAYVADKAVYEGVYEARNRPSWLSIPLAALTRHSQLPGATVERNT